LDIEDYKTAPRIVADMIIRLKKRIGSKLLIVSPENVAIYQATSIPSADVGGQAFNYFVPIINLADAYIDLYQPQVYNNWFGGLPGGSLAYMQETYLHWRNLQGTMAWSGPIPNFKGVDGNKLVMGVLASTSAGGSQFYAPPHVIREFKSWIKQNNYPLKGFMMWDSNWDILNGMVISNAATDLDY
jgi:chitinase